MPDLKAATLVKTVKSLANQKAELDGRVKHLIASLDAELQRIGHRIVALDGAPMSAKRRGRPPGKASAAGPSSAKAPKKRGRKAMSSAERAAVSKRMKAYWSKRKKATAKAK